MDDFKKSKDPGVILPFTVLRRVDCVLGGRGVESRFVTTFKDRTTALTEASLLLAVLFLGSNFVAVKYAVGEMPPLPFVAMRFTLAGLVGTGWGGVGLGAWSLTHATDLPARCLLGPLHRPLFARPLSHPCRCARTLPVLTP